MRLYNYGDTSDIKGFLVDQHIFNKYTDKDLEKKICEQFKIPKNDLKYILNTSQVGIFIRSSDAYKAYYNTNDEYEIAKMLHYGEDTFKKLQLEDLILGMIYIKE